MKKCLALFFTLNLTWVQAQEGSLSLTLNQALDLAKKQNVDVALAQLRLDQFESKYKEVVGSGLPTIMLSANATRNIESPVVFFSGNEIRVGDKNTAQAALTATQPLFVGGKVISAARGAHQALHAQEKNVEFALQEIQYVVKQLFFSIIFSQEAVSIGEENLQSAQKHLKTIQERYNQGLDSDLSLRRQEVEVANAQTALISAKNLVENGKLSLTEVLALDMNLPLKIEGAFEEIKPLSGEYPSLAREALERRPDVVSAREMTKAYREAVRVARGDYFPRLGAFGNMNWSMQSANSRFSESDKAKSVAAGLQLDWGLFQGGQVYQRVRQARITYEEARLSEEKLERAAQREFRSAWLAVQEAQDRAAAQGAAVGQARQALKATEVRHSQGQASQLELTDAQTAFNEAQLRKALAVRDYWVGVAAMEKMLGRSPFVSQ